jgi:hypothetical protein
MIMIFTKPSRSSEEADMDSASEGPSTDIAFFDPRGKLTGTADAYALGLGARLEAPGVVVGLLANGFADSELFLAHVGRALRKHVPTVTLREYGKLDPSIPAEPELVNCIVNECDAVVAGYGH